MVEDDNTDIRDEELRLSMNAEPVGENRGTRTWTPGLLTVAYGDAKDLWGLTLEPAQVNASGFGVALRVRNHGSSGDGQIDAIAVEVTYCH